MDASSVAQELGPVLADLVDAKLAPLVERLAADAAALAAFRLEVETMRESLVADVLSMVPAGKDGADGPAGPVGPAGIAGKDGEPGADGAGLEEVLIDQDGRLVVTFSDGRTRTAGVVVGRDGDAGKDGADGMGPDNYELIDGPLAVTHRLTFGGRVREWTIAKPSLADWFRKGWQSGTEYGRGSVVMYSGQPWLALADTSGRPDDSADWALIVKRPRDGRDGGPVEAKRPARVSL